METIIAAVISGAVTLLVCLANNKAQFNKTQALNLAEQEKTRAILENELKHLSERVEKHNNLIERTYKLEGQMKECQHEITDLKAYHKPN